MDLCFAISATTANSVTTFTLMTETMKDVVERYGIGKIRYSVIVFGSQAVQVLGFDSGFSNPAELEKNLTSLDPVGGGPALDEALKKALEAFEVGVPRRNAKKVLVVMTDKESGLGEDEVLTKAKPLEGRGIRVIAVAVGDEADKKELENIASDKRDVLTVTESIRPKELSKHLMVLILTGILTQ